MGLKRVIPNLRTVAYVEREAYAVANLVAKIEAGQMDAAPIWTDVKTFDGQSFRNRVDIITGGYPCQSFSVAGKRLGAKDPRHLWPYIARIVQAVRPVWCFFENVSGHLTLGFPEVYRSLRDMGYKIEAGLFSAAECGAPHRRERLFILAHNGDGDSWQRCSASNEHCSGFRGRQETKPSSPISGCCYGELADTNRERFQEQRGSEPILTAKSKPEYSHIYWPARPGQPQYEWEEPRVVGDTRKQKSEGLSQSKERLDNREVGDTGRQGQTQSRLGRTVNGPPYSLDMAKGIRGGYLVKPGGEIGHNLVMEAKIRVDRLRLLGNGVVPQQAEKAFGNLIELFL